MFGLRGWKDRKLVGYKYFLLESTKIPSPQFEEKIEKWGIIVVNN